MAGIALPNLQGGQTAYPWYRRAAINRWGVRTALRLSRGRVCVEVSLHAAKGLFSSRSPAIVDDDLV